MPSKLHGEELAGRTISVEWPLADGTTAMCMAVVEGGKKRKRDDDYKSAAFAALILVWAAILMD